MRSLYHSLLAQHARHLKPIHCAQSTSAQLLKCFEEMVVENNLAALVVEAFPFAHQRSTREINRIQRLVGTASSLFVLASPNDPLINLEAGSEKNVREAIIVELAASERFIMIASESFSALFASTSGESASETPGGESVFWTFEPAVVRSALEHLTARIKPENPHHAVSLSRAAKVSSPKSTSSLLTLEITTKLARLIQQLSEREVVVSHISATINHSRNLGDILQAAVNEVGKALNVRSCVACLTGRLIEEPLHSCYTDPDVCLNQETMSALIAEVETVTDSLRIKPKTFVDAFDAGSTSATVPLIYDDALLGILRVQSDDPNRVWTENELLLLNTVSEQLVTAVRQAHLHLEMESQALTDGLTGCFNRRSFEMQLERDLHLATRMRQPVSLVMLDLDHFKAVNDHEGHDVGDVILRTLAKTLRSEVRAVDTTARFGADEFAIILPQASIEGARIVAERLRRRVEETEIPGYGSMTASFGYATFPTHASSRDTIIAAAERALYDSRNSGGNGICGPRDEDLVAEVDDPGAQGSRERMAGALSGAL